MGYQDKVVLGDCTLYLGDCLEVMKDIPDKSVDAVITDPPYGIGIVENSGRLKELGYKPIVGDLEKIDLTFILGLSERVFIFGGNYFKLPISSGWIIWDKQNGKKVDYGDCELIWTSIQSAPKIITHVWDGFVRDSDKGIRRVHPTQKPTGLIKRIVLDNTLNNEFIFDPFMGSGTTGVACVQTGRKFIGIEIDPKYFEIAVKRIKDAQQQMRLPL